MARTGTIPVSGSTGGYFAGGNSYSGTNIMYEVTTDKISFSTGVTAASTISNLTLARTIGAGISDGQW